MKTNYHSHTIYCGHSTNKIEELVKTAIEAGFVEFGISEHLPIPTNPKRQTETKYFNQLIEEYKIVKEKYKDQIKLFLGLETEYHEDIIDLVKGFYNDKDIDYLIFGNHCFNSPKENLIQWRKTNQKELIENWDKNLILALESKMFSCICHPDTFIQDYGAWNKQTEELTQKIIDLSIQYNVPLEFNVNGLYTKLYTQAELDIPIKQFWEMVSKSKAKVIVGLDAHTINILNTKLWDIANNIIKEWNIEKNIVKKIPFPKKQISDTKKVIL
ncbi:MAG: PHP domain-containing protein [Mycoplasma sp.]